MNSKDPISYEVLISSNISLLKAGKKKKKEIWRFLRSSNATIHKVEYAYMYWSCRFYRIQYHQMICVLRILEIVIVYVCIIYYEGNKKT